MLVVVRGPLLSVTGYGSHTRQVWKWAMSKGWDVRAQIVPWGMCTYYINPDEEEGLIGEIMERSGNLPEGVKPDLSLQVQLPDEWDPNLAKTNVGITAGIEADKCNPSWIEACSKMDKVVVPSTYSKLSFTNGGLPREHIVNVPESYTCGFEKTENYHSMMKRLDGLSTPFNFLIFGQITGRDVATDRKNTVNMIRWICDEFKDDPDVGIVLKTNMGRLTCHDRLITTQSIENLLAQVRKGPYPKVHVVHGLMDKNEISALMSHEKIKCLTAATRGEGWGLPILDACVNKLPVIATKHSGHMDFLRNVRFIELEYTREQIPDALVDGRIWVEGAKWAQPSEKHFRHRVRKFRKSPDVPRGWAEESFQHIFDRYSMETISKDYDEALGDLI